MNGAFRLGAVAAAGGVVPGPGNDPHFGNVVLLVHGDSEPIKDSSSAQRAPTVSSVVVDTEVKKFGLGSLKNEVSAGGNVRFASNIAFALKQIYTLEFWIRIPSAPASTVYFMAGANVRYFNINTARLLSVSGYGANINVGVLELGLWYHIALTRDASNQTRIFRNGVLIMQGPDASTAATAVEFGMFGIPGRADLASLVGNLDEVRYTQDVCRYVASFDPPDAPFPNS